MKLNRLVIPSFDEQHQPNPNLTLIHGWGAESQVWANWAKQAFSADYTVILIDLPGFGGSPALPNSDTLEHDWIEVLIQALPDKTHLIGWSLGGMLAQQISLRCPTQILSLTCLASTPRFTQNDNWPLSVSPKIIGDFIKAVGLEAANTLKSFWRLQLQGSQNSRALMKQLQQQMALCKLPTLTGLNQGLALLKDMDNRNQLSAITAPTLWLLGEKDPLIPQDIQNNLVSLQPKACVQVIPGGSHIPFFSQPDETAAFILQFLKQA